MNSYSVEGSVLSRLENYPDIEFPTPLKMYISLPLVQQTQLPQHLQSLPVGVYLTKDSSRAEISSRLVNLIPLSALAFLSLYW